MALSAEQVSTLCSIRDEWNKAENTIKLAEQVCNEIVFPSINELRYAGRRLVDLIDGIYSGASEEELSALLADARFDCHRARHDAIDAATAHIATQIQIMVKLLRYDAIIPAFPTFPALVKDLDLVRARIAISRENRGNRASIYAAIEEADFPRLVTSYRSLLESEPMMLRIAKQHRARDFFGKWSFFVSIAALIAAVLLAIFADSLPQITIAWPR